MDIHLPYFTNRHDTDGEDVNDAKSSFAPSESDCSALVDLKTRVRELDGMLNDLEDNRSNDSYENDSEDGYDDSGLDNDDLFDSDLSLQNRNEFTGYDPDDKATSLDYIDIVRSLSALAMKQNLTPHDLEASIEEMFGERKPEKEKQPLGSEADSSSQELSQGCSDQSTNEKMNERNCFGKTVLVSIVVCSTLGTVAYFIIRN